MSTVNLNHRLGEILTNHGIAITYDDTFVYADLPVKAKLTAQASYSSINSFISSRLDVVVITNDGETIIECFGDLGADVESAINNNLTNFCLSSLHVLLVALGCGDHDSVNQVLVENWEINGRNWIAYLGNVVSKGSGVDVSDINFTDLFFNAIKSEILKQPLNNALHWFRGFHLQHEGAVAGAEFLMDNQNSGKNDQIFSNIPIIANAKYFSCRVFVILRAA